MESEEISRKQVREEYKESNNMIGHHLMNEKDSFYRRKKMT